MPPLPPPNRILFLRPDTYGDLFLFEPMPRIVRDAWKDAELAVLIRQAHADAIPLFASEGIQWLTTDCDPYRESPADNPAALDDLRAVVQAFAPDCIVAACADQTWLEPAVAAFLPEARQVSFGAGLTDPVLRAALDAVLPVDWARIYPEKVAFDPTLPEWERSLALAAALIGGAAPRWWPVATVPEPARAQAAQFLSGAGLRAGEFVACAAAGIANVQIKAWPAEQYGHTLAWLERERGIRALLMGHASERQVLETALHAARAGGANPALWLGEDGEMALAAGLLEAGRFYFGNDTGVLHLAAALGRPVVPIFGGGHWPRFQPVARRALTIVQPLPCFGCAWDCLYTDAPCVRTISQASVRQALDQFLNHQEDGQRVFEAAGLDAGARALINTATPKLRFLRDDRDARGKQITELTDWLLEARNDPRVADASAALIDDLRLRLQGSQAEERAARAQARRFARELALARRLLKFSFAAPPPIQPKPVLLTRTTTKAQRLRNALLDTKVSFHLDSCELGGSLLITGWAFRRSMEWDAQATSISLLFRRDGQTVHHALSRRVPRPDVATYFAAQPTTVPKGARGLEGAGFACEIAPGLLPAGVGLEIVLRLESAGRTCDQPTGEQLCL